MKLRELLFLCACLVSGHLTAVTDESPAHHLSTSVRVELISVNRVRFFYDRTVTLGCRVPDDDSQWKIMRDNRGVSEECSGQVKKDDFVLCTISSKSPLRMPYWCQSAAGQTSNVFNASKAVRDWRRSREEIWTKFELTPGWFVRSGDSALLNCSIYMDRLNHSGNMDLQLLWTQLAFNHNDMKVLRSQRASLGLTFFLDNISHEHSGLYTCWDDGTLPEVSVSPLHHFIWADEESPPVTIKVLSPNRVQFFSDEEVTLGCQLPNDRSRWKIKWYDLITHKIVDCREPKLSASRFLTCSMVMVIPWYDKLFWCESSTGGKSNLLNTTCSRFNIVLEAPTVPVTEGDDLTLSCLKQDQNNKVIPTPAEFYGDNGLIIGSSDTGTFTIKNVTRADEGFYQCLTSSEGMSYKTWIQVKARV